MKVLFVCTGNTCRSPMAEGFYNSIFGSGASSAGIYAYTGDYPSENAVEAMKLNGIDISHHRAKRLKPEDITEADRVYGMTDGHAAILATVFPEAKDKIMVLGSGIMDPFGEDLEAYIKCADQIKEYITELDIQHE